MAEYTMAEAVNKDVSFRLIGESTTLLPVRVEIRGVTGRYRFILTTPDRSRSFITAFDSPTTISRNINNAVASRYEPTWQIGIEGV
jgi:hypothetical protein